MPAWIRHDAARATHHKLCDAGLAARGLEDAVMEQMALDGVRVVRGLVGMLGKPNRAGDAFVKHTRAIGVATQNGATTKEAGNLIKTLVKVGRWERENDGYWVLDFLVYNHTADEWQAVVDKYSKAGQASGASRRRTSVEHRSNERSNSRSTNVRTNVGTNAEPFTSSVEDLRSSSSEDEDFEAALQIIVDAEAAEQSSRGNTPKSKRWYEAVTAQRRELYRKRRGTAPADMTAEQLAAFLVAPEQTATVTALSSSDIARRDLERAIRRAELTGDHDLAEDKREELSRLEAAS